MISLKKLFQEPRLVGDFFRRFVNDTRGFAKDLNLDEELKYSLYTLILVLVSTSALKILKLSLTNMILTLVLAVFFTLFSAILTFGIAYISKAKMNFTECITLISYISILSLPLTILSKIFGFLGLLSIGVYYLITYLVLVESKEANKNTVTWVIGLMVLILILLKLMN